MPNVPIDWASVNWLYVVLLALLVFLSTLVGTSIALKRTFLGAVLSTLLFTAGFIFWTYYPHKLPLPTSPAGQKTVVPVPQPAPPAVPAAPSTPAQPDKPIKDITPPPTNAR